MKQILTDNPLLLLFIVAAIGYFVGSIKIKGSSLGVAAVLFVGLAFGAISHDFTIPDIVFSLGLVLFVYSIGISSGAAFFNSYKKNGVRDFIFILIMLIVSGLIAVALSFMFGFDAAKITGIYAGSTTNTPAMAGVLDYMSTKGINNVENTSGLVVGYSYSYPMGVLGGIIAIVLMERIFRIDFKQEKENLKSQYPIGEDLTSMSIEVLSDDGIGTQLRDLKKIQQWNVNFGRVEVDGITSLASFNQVFKKGDKILAVGPKKELLRVAKFMGRISDDKLSHYRGEYDSRRIFVSNPDVIGKTIPSLNLDEKYNAIITRLRRGDMDMLVKEDTVLEQGDRIRFVARRKDLKALSNFFGDSYTQSSKVNLFSFGLGIGLGLLLGLIEFKITDSFSFKLGYAGGPLIVALILGALRRTGPIVWTLPYSANVILQQVGLILFLAAIGVKSGHSFVESFASDGFYIIGASAIISLLTAIITLVVGYKIVKIPFSILSGIVSNQPAILDFAQARANSTLPTFGYSMVFPIALIMKIVIAQILFIILN